MQRMYTCIICCSLYSSKQLDLEIMRDVQCQLDETNDWTYVIYDGIFPCICFME